MPGEEAAADSGVADRDAWGHVTTARQLFEGYRHGGDDQGHVKMTEIQVCGLEAVLALRAKDEDVAYRSALLGGKLITEQHLKGDQTQATNIVGYVALCDVFIELLRERNVMRSTVPTPTNWSVAFLRSDTTGIYLVCPMYSTLSHSARLDEQVSILRADEDTGEAELPACQRSNSHVFGRSYRG